MKVENIDRAVVLADMLDTIKNNIQQVERYQTEETLKMPNVGNFTMSLTLTGAVKNKMVKLISQHLHEEERKIIEQIKEL